jgi:mono/diheme cytochrome c family protein
MTTPRATGMVASSTCVRKADRMTGRSLCVAGVIVGVAVVLVGSALGTRAVRGAPQATAPSPGPTSTGRGQATRPNGDAQPAAGRGRRSTRPPDSSAHASPDDPTNATADFSPKPPVVALSPEDELEQFWLPAGYRMTPIVSEPVIEDPAQIAFDGDGRMFVLELRGYFESPDGIDETPPLGRISRFEDVKHDGSFTRHTVFVDHLVFPRFVLPFGKDAILTMETNQDDVWKYTDTDGDGVADRKEIFTTNFGRAGGIEHQQSSLFWAMDNWLYSTVNAYRIRWTPQGILREPTGPNGAQWGVTQDNTGKVWFQGGASGMPGYFQFPIHYGNFAWPDQFEPNLEIIWGAPILVGDIQQGLSDTRMPDGSLIYGTAAAGNQIYRGDRLPADLAGDYLYGEVVGRVIRRLRPVRHEGLTELTNVYPRSEFIRSIDPLFRPAWNVTGPDGTIYIADMYRGMIEGAEWAKEGTYLRRKIEQYQLDKIVHHGRIWRLTYDGIARDTTEPRMLEETPTELVTHLAHPNGWWRDTAQQLLVLAQDRSVVPALETMATTSTNALARVHAIWTLEGLNSLSASIARRLLADPDPTIRMAAMRASETLYKAGDSSFAADYRTLARDTDVDVAIQALLTLNVLKVSDATAVASQALSTRSERGIQFVANRIVNPPANSRAGGVTAARLPPDQRAALDRGGAIYDEVCFACHGDDGHGTPLPGGRGGATVAPALAGSPRVTGHRDYVINAILHGLTGPIHGATYSQVMVPMGTNTDEWIADVASFVRNSFGNSASIVTPADVARARAASARRTTPWTVDALERALPHVLRPDASWTVTASQVGRRPPSANDAGGFNMAGTAADVLNFLGWTTGVPQTPGMWVQVELPAAVRLIELEFTSPTIGGGRNGEPEIATYPRHYEVRVSTDGRTWSAPIAQGDGASGTNTLTFAPVSAKFIRLTQTGTAPDGAPWSMRLLRLYEAPSPDGGS